VHTTRQKHIKFFTLEILNDYQSYHYRINWDKTIFVKRFPKEGEEVKVERIIDIPGGKGANVGVASSRILGRDKGALFGAIGLDLYLQIYIPKISKENLV
jgi:sugar/nucleoside kinase (ribokinase family)